jgi:clan AA aspartic protease
MMTGAVSAALETMLPLSVQGPGGQPQPIDAVVDTGFNGFLTLPPALIASLGLPWISSIQATLADGSSQQLDVDAVRVLWEGQPRTVDVQAVDAPVLIGMKLLQGSELRIEVVAGGAVTITAIP